jgi:hypothetical protein
MKAHLARVMVLVRVLALAKVMFSFYFISLAFLFPFMWYHSKENMDSLARVL